MNTVDRMQAVRADITEFEIDAVVNAANRSLLGGGGVDSATHRKAGPGLLEECRTLTGCETGEAKITGAYLLPARFVIHTVGPIYSGKPDDAHKLENCYRNSLQLAADGRFNQIAFPAISCGIYGYPIQEAASIAVDAAFSFLDKHEFPSSVLFALFSQDHHDIYLQKLKRMGLR